MSPSVISAISAVRIVVLAGVGAIVMDATPGPDGYTYSMRGGNAAGRDDMDDEDDENEKKE
jgi:hypothetical protein